jgi:hypothetical protein
MKNYSNNFYITPNLLVTQEETEIIDCLTDHNEMPTDFEESCVRSFFMDKDFHLVLYFPQKEDPGFQMFVIQDFSVHVEELLILRDLFGQLIQQGQNALFMQKAHCVVDDIIQMAHTYKALLHGRDIMPEDDYLPGNFSTY